MAIVGKCPRCNAAITAALDEGGFLSCSQCGARLRSAAPAPGGALPPAMVDLRPAPGTDGVEALRAEIGALWRGQAQILQALGEILAFVRADPSGGGVTPGLDADGGSGGFAESGPAATAPPMRTRRRQKTVLFVDDDEEARDRACAALAQAQVPIRSVADGNAALAAIAAEKPDILVLELGLGGAMGGRDVINMVRATMEWIDIRILLYTRLPVGNADEFRTVHGADDFVPKAPGSEEKLVARVIQLFQKG